MTWAVRRATLDDHEGIADLCRAAAGTDDYYLEALDHDLRKEVVHVALDGERIIGSMVFHETLDRAGWLGAARTHPDVRGRGVARALVESFEAHARSRGIPVLRLWTDASNAAGVAAFRKAGFQEATRFTRVQRAADPADRAPDVLPVPLSGGLERRLRGSPVLEASRGFASHDYVLLRLPHEVLAVLAGRGHLRGWDDHVLLFSRAAEGFRDDVLEIFPLLGDPGALLRAAAAIAASLGRRSVEAFLPRDGPFVEAARAAGYGLMAWGREAILCEKPLPRPPGTP